MLHSLSIVLVNIPLQGKCNHSKQNHFFLLLFARIISGGWTGRGAACEGVGQRAQQHGHGLLQVCVWDNEKSEQVYLSLLLSISLFPFLSPSISFIFPPPGQVFRFPRHEMLFKRKIIIMSSLSFSLFLPPSTLLHLPLSLSVSRTTWERLKRCAAYFCAYDDYNWDWTLAVSQITSSFLHINSPLFMPLFPFFFLSLCVCNTSPYHKLLNSAHDRCSHS